MLEKPHSSILNRMVALILFGKRSLTLVLTLLLFFWGKLYPISVLSNFGCKNCPLDLIIANSRAFEIRLEREREVWHLSKDNSGLFIRPGNSKPSEPLLSLVSFQQIAFLLLLAFFLSTDDFSDNSKNKSAEIVDTTYCHFSSVCLL